MSEPEERKLPELPHDAIVDILSRLPCKSLLKFRCVSKQWNSIIRSHKFTKLQLSKSIGDTSRQRVLLRLKPSFCSINYEDLDDFVEGHFEVISREDAPPLLADVDFFLYDSYVVGQCHGLFCIMMSKREETSFLLWNPTTRECKEVKKNDVANMVDAGCMFDIKKIRWNPCEGYGFGYDSSSDDYKIVRLSGPQTNVVVVEIYKIGSRIWKKLEQSISDTIYIFQSILSHNICPFLNGACHWVALKSSNEDSLILRFDLRKEVVEEVALPQYLSKSEFLYEVIVFDGKLALPNKVNDVEMEFWVMDEYGVGSSFTKKVTMHAAPGSRLSNFTIAICLPKNGGVLMFNDGCRDRLPMISPETKIRKKATYIWEPHFLAVYAESLISPYHIPNANDNL
ncbi:unnamed protein product [Rhodiola kirilowii]